MPIRHIASALSLGLVACSAPLKRPMVDSPTTGGLNAFYVLKSPSACPKTRKDCEGYLKKTGGDTVVRAICELNLGRLDDALAEAGRVADTCYGKVIGYDVAVDRGLEKGKRFDYLQSIFECTSDDGYREMIQIRSKRAHYE